MTSRVFAESGLSEAAREENFVLTDKYAISVIHDTDLGEDSIDIYEYEKNPTKNFLTAWYKMDYSVKKDPVNVYAFWVNFDNPVYIQGDYIWDDTSYFDYKTGTYYNVHDDPTPTFGWDYKTEFKKVLSDEGISVDKSQIFDYKYISTHYQPLDINNMEDFSDVMALMFGIPLACVCMVIVIVISVIVLVLVQSRKKKRIN